ncbi:18304_t:CDS:2 [Funneliformis geosporum]|nr:18304_t:CDS:2 [Funneliformis geosporum]
MSYFSRAFQAVLPNRDRNEQVSKVVIRTYVNKDLEEKIEAVTSKTPLSLPSSAVVESLEELTKKLQNTLMNLYYPNSYNQY